MTSRLSFAKLLSCITALRRLFEHTVHGVVAIAQLLPVLTCWLLLAAIIDYFAMPDMSDKEMRKT
jgi:hypothetical protein